MKKALSVLLAISCSANVSFAQTSVGFNKTLLEAQAKAEREVHAEVMRLNEEAVSKQNEIKALKNQIRESQEMTDDITLAAGITVLVSVSVAAMMVVSSKYTKISKENLTQVIRGAADASLVSAAVTTGAHARHITVILKNKAEIEEFYAELEQVEAKLEAEQENYLKILNQ